MKYIEARVPRDAALQFFERRRFGNLYGLLRRRSAFTPDGKRLPYAELVWMPFYRIDFQVTSRRGPGAVSVSVEAYSGSFAVFQMQDNLVEGEPEGDSFPPEMTEEAAIKTGRRELLRTIMRRRSQQEKPVIEDTLAVDVFYYPFWIYYFQRRGKYIDIKLQDALNGESGGNRNRAGVLAAFTKRAGEQDQPRS